MFWRGSEPKIKEAPKRLVSITKVSLPKATAFQIVSSLGSSSVSDSEHNEISFSVSLGFVLLSSTDCFMAQYL